jgi:hypothetical protein
MNFRALFVSVNLILVGFAAPSSAGTILQNHPGSLPLTAQVVPFGPLPLTDIVGNINNAAGEIDMYEIFLTGGGTFSATTVSNVSNFFDTELFLFDSNGFGIYANNDDLNAGGQQSTLPANDPLTPLASGYYFLAITSNGIEPISAGGTIFDLADNPSFLVLGPNGPGGSQPITGWQGTSTESGSAAYDIAVTGAVAAPEPSYLPVLVLAALGLAYRHRRRQPSE